jgi:hypothetical protein
VPVVAADGAVWPEALARSGRRHGPGLFGLVTEAGQVVFEGSVGVADMAKPRPIGAHHGIHADPAGRCVILWQNGLDDHDPLSADAPFIRAALAG